MSTQPIEPRRLPVARRRRPEGRRLAGIGLAFAAVFAAAFLIGHTRGSGGGRELEPPSLPAVATPVPAELPSAPPIAVGVSTRLLERERREARAAAAAAAAARAQRSTVSPLVSPATQPTAPARTVAPVTSSPVTPTGPATPSPSSGSSHEGNAGGKTKGGTSFDSSG